MRDLLSPPVIMAPVDSAAEVGPLVDAGATELFCGLLNTGLRESALGLLHENARHIPRCNVDGVHDLRRLADEAQARGARVYLALNVAQRADGLLHALEDARLAEASGLHGVIVADVALMRRIHEEVPQLELLASTLAGGFHSGAARYLQQLGVARLVLPRTVTMADVRATAAAVPDMDLEVFLLGERCRFPNATCSLEHYVPTSAMDARFAEFSDETPACAQRYAFVRLEERHGVVHREEQGLQPLEDPEAQVDACGLCVVHDLVRLPAVRALKVVGRGRPLQDKLRFVRQARDALDLAARLEDRAEFCAGVQQVRRLATHGMCGPAYCYHDLTPAPSPPPRVVRRRRMSPVGRAFVPELPAGLPAGVEVFVPVVTPEEIDALGGRAHGVVLGEEFCGRRLSAAEQLVDTARIALGQGLRLQLCLPILTELEIDGTLEIVTALLDAHAAHGSGTRRLECTVNEIGAAFLLRERFAASLEIVAGRALVRQRTDPRIHLRKTHEQSAAMTRLPVALLQQLAEDFSIGRLELSNVSHGVHLPDLAGFRLTLHLGDALVSVTRACLTHALEFRSREGYLPGGARSCELECFRTSFELRSPREAGLLLLLEGNAVLADTAGVAVPPWPNADRVVLHAARCGRVS